MSIIVTGGAGMIGSNIIEGLNKSGHIAEKCAATFSSLGISSFYVHANEAFHGDFHGFHPGGSLGNQVENE
jgi:D-arabinose 5-phosphate isomerase GutQ